MARTFVILHGWLNHRPPGHWQFELAKEMEALGEDVRYPQLPDADEPIRVEWLATLADVWESIPEQNEKIVIAHSLATILWLHAVAELNLHAERVLLVAPAGPTFLDDEPLLRNFLPLPGRIDGSAWRLVCSDEDPHCVEGPAEYFGSKYHCDIDLIPRAGHLALSDGYGKWPSVLAWALDPKVRLVAR